MTRVLVSVGDVSGDSIAAALVRVLRTRHPEWRFSGLVGPALRAEGVEPVASSEDLAVGGFAELLPSAPRILGTWRRMIRHLREAPPDVVVLVDAGGFHLPFARAIRRHSRAPILYYVPPQVWAWRPGRLRKLLERTDRIASILPNEPGFYAAHGADVDFVGHPILDRAVAVPPDPAARAGARDRLGVTGSAPVLGLFPGSRRNEVARHLPLQLAAAATLRARDARLSELHCVVVRAPSIDRTEIEAILAAQTLAAQVTDDPVAGMDACDVALSKPGTVTLELALRERPMVVMGRTSRLSAAIARRSLSVDWFALPNLLLGEEVVPERIQRDAEPDRLADALAPLFSHGDPSPEAEAQRAAFRRLRACLGDSGASERAADLVEALIGTDRT